ncbi:MAG TPA: DUF6084 family protein [Chthonomonadaceae bacterium]|nr:DUF6084 family protein [Chthonomonadaceae bacterium]
MPELDFLVSAVEAMPYAAVPTLLFKLALRNATEGEQIHAVMLRVQIRIEATKRHYDAEAEARLLELFGEPNRWDHTLRSLLWTHVALSVPPFSAHLVADLPVVCTYDFDVVGSKYLNALEDGDVPLLFLFSGTALYSREGSGLQVAQIPWEKEATFRMPVKVWREMIEHYFPNTAWLRLRRDVFDRLYRFKAHNALLTWEETFERLLQHEAEREPHAWIP